jgi:hypothetical protein
LILIIYLIAIRESDEERARWSIGPQQTPVRPETTTNAASGPTSPAHADFVMALAARKPAPIALEPEDFMARAICCEALIDRFKLHLTAPDEDAAENEPGCSIRDAELTSAIDAHLGDLRSDITRTLEQIAERIRDDRYDGCPRSPFYRRRGP